MKKGFYILQLTNADIKIETISYLDTHSKFDTVVKAVFICESIAEIITNSLNRNPTAIAIKIMHLTDLTCFNKVELLNIKKLISELVSDYLK